MQIKISEDIVCDIYIWLRNRIYSAWCCGAGAVLTVYMVWESMCVCKRKEQTLLNRMLVRVLGPPGFFSFFFSELECECCITGSHWELKDPGGRQRHFLLYLPAGWLAWQRCLASPWATPATCVQSTADQHARLRGTSIVTRHQRQRARRLHTTGDRLKGPDQW